MLSAIITMAADIAVASDVIFSKSNMILSKLENEGDSELSPSPFSEAENLTSRSRYRTANNRGGNRDGLVITHRGCNGIDDRALKATQIGVVV